MNGALLSLMAMYNFDDSIFDRLYIPEGLDKDVLCDNLLMETAEFELLYADFDFLKAAIGRWSTKQLPVWEKLYNTLLLEYNPLENYDRQETWSDSAEGTNSTHTESAGSQAGSTADTGSRTDSSTGSDTLTVAGYNTNDLTNREKNDTINSVESHDTREINTQMEHSDEANANGQNTHESQHTGRVHGNIGVTTSQQMLEAEREVVKFNVYDYIINDFKNRFCLLIY